MWRYHPSNGTKQAWQDMLLSMQTVIRHAEENAVTLVVEPEIANVVDSAQKARQLLDEIQSDRLKIVIDAANLFPSGTLGRQREILDAAFQLLGEHIIMAHAKDLDKDGAAGNLPAGTGLLDYDYYIGILREIGFQGPLILHSLEETQVAAAKDFLLQRLDVAAR
jgi:sugar phosphate isomerase/epimerase